MRRGDALQPAAQFGCRKRGRLAQQRGHGVGARHPGLYARRGQAAQRGGREAVQQVGLVAGRAQAAPAPRIHAFDHTRLRQRRQDTGVDQRRLARAAHAQHQQESASTRILRDERRAHVADRAGAAEIDRGVLELEGREPAERRAARPGDGRCCSGHAGGRRAPLGDQRAQVGLEHTLELVGVLERLERGTERGLRVAEPLVDKTIERVFLREGVERRGAVGEADRTLGLLDVGQQQRRARRMVGTRRFFELELGAGGVARAVVALELLGKYRAQARPQHEQDEVDLGGAGDLLLEMLGGPQRLVLPEDRADVEVGTELAAQALDHGERDAALEAHIAG